MSEPNAEQLLAHAGFVRAIAFDLLRDHGRADDVVQETMLAAVRRPPRGRLRPWLGTVARRIALTVRRSEGRRSRREAAVRRRTAPPSTHEVVANLEIQRHVVDAVQALGEPYRSAVYCRYFHDLGPSEIAKREGVPVRTIESRLRRGLARLRSDLDARDGSWSVALMALVGAGWRPAASGATLAVAAGIVVTTGVGLLVWRTTAAQSPPARAAEARVAQPTGAESDVSAGRERNAEWDALLAALPTVEFGSLEAGRLAKRIEAYLLDNPGFRDAALDEIVARDGEESWPQAAVLSVACGRVADESLAVSMATLLAALRTDALRACVICALGANRHDLPPTCPGYGESAYMSNLGAPIAEEEVRQVLLARATSLRGRDPVEWEYLVLLKVLAFSQDEDPAIAALFHGLATSEDFDEHQQGAWGLRLSRRAEALDYLRRQMEEPYESSRVVGPAAWALLRAGTREDGLTVLDYFERDETEIEARRVLLNSICTMQIADPVVRDRRRQVVMRLATDSSDPGLQKAALNFATGLMLEDYRALDVLEALQRIAEDADQPPASRVQAVVSLGRLGRNRPELEDWLYGLAVSDKNPALLRAEALRYWTRYATEETRASMRKLLDAIEATDGGVLAEALDAARARLTD